LQQRQPRRQEGTTDNPICLDSDSD
jgi:hypothetical protein